MDTQKLKAFFSVLNNGSFTKAAEDFNYTPSAFSHIADSLEDELNVKLFNRTHTGVTITEEGKALIACMQGVIDAEDLLFNTALKYSNKKKKIVIGAYSSIANTLLPKILKDFKADNPNISISVKISDRVLKLLKDGSVDLILSAKENYEDLNWIPLFEDEYMVVAPKSFEIEGKSVSPCQLYEYNYLRTNEKIEKNIFDLSKFKDVISVESDDYSSHISLVEEEMGITVLPKLSLMNCGKKVKLLHLEPKIYRNIGIICKKETLKRSEVTKLVKYLEYNK